MDILPNEIVSHILSYLPQRYVFIICSTISRRWNQLITRPTFYTNLDIYSNKHLENVIQLLIERNTINNNNNNSNNNIGHYVERLVFHYDCLAAESIKNVLVAFPNLQYIYGLEKLYSRNLICVLSNLKYNQPTDLIYMHTNDEMALKLNQAKDHLKSLHICITEELHDFVPLQQQSSETIHLITKGSVNNGELNSDFPIKILVLPKEPFTCLVKLKINFFYYKGSNDDYPFHIYDEHTFENIHQSCPLLQSLQIENFYMKLSDKYNEDDNNINNIITPALCLKNLEVNSVHFIHPNCFQYLANKYPYLESLSLNMYFNYLLSTKKMDIQNRALVFIKQFPLLKKLTFQRWSECNDTDPYYELIEYLSQYPNQLTHFDYLFPLTLDAYISMYTMWFDDDGNDNNNNKEYNENNDNDFLSLLHQQQQLPTFNFLNQLTSLSLDVDNIINLAYKLLLKKNPSTVIISLHLTELKIKRSEKETSLMYFYDWMDMFPNLLLFHLEHDSFILDDSDFFNRYKNEYVNKGGNIISNKLHQLIKKIKQQQQQQPQKQPFIKPLKKSNKEIHPLYKLKELNLSVGALWFKNGLNDFLKDCYQLKILRIYMICFVNGMNPTNEIHLDLSHLHLELLNMDQLFCSSPKKNQYRNKIELLNIDEAITGFKRVIKMDPYSDRIQQFSIYLKCKFIDRLIRFNESSPI